MADVVVGLTGYKGSGKDTLGKILVEDHGFTRVGLADAVKDAVYALNPIVEVETMAYPYESCCGSEVDVETEEIRVQYLVDTMGWDWTKNNVPEARRLLDAMGTKVGREMFGSDSWIKVANERIKQIDGNVVVTDVRFKNERYLCDFVVRVNRRGAVLDPSLTSEVSVDSVPVEFEIGNHEDVRKLDSGAKLIVDYCQNF